MGRRTSRLRLFTLAELVVSVVLLGLLVSIAAVSYSGFLEDSRQELLHVEVASFDSAYLGFLMLGDGRTPEQRADHVISTMSGFDAVVDTSDLASSGVVEFSRGTACVRLTLPLDDATSSAARMVSCAPPPGDTATTVPPTTTTAPSVQVSVTSTTDLAFASSTTVSYSIEASGATGPYSFAVTSGILPTGVSLSADGTFTGTGTYRFRPGSISAGYDFTCALDFEGAAWCWGDNDWNQLGIGTSGGRNRPTKVADGELPGGNVGLSSISAGEYHACAVKSGEAFCWGYNVERQLGSATTGSKSVPTKVVDGVMGNSGVTAISAGSEHTCAIKDTEAYCWGKASTGKLGNGTSTSTLYASPVKVLAGVMPSTTGVTAIGTGEDNTCVLNAGVVYCWGNNLAGSVGNGFTSGASPSPVKVLDSTMGNSGLTGLSVGTRTACVLKEGVAWCWGENGTNQIGNGSSTDRSSPAMVGSGAMGNSGITQISMGDFHACAIKETEAYCWGRNSEGQLGDGTTTSRTTPVKVAAGAMGATAGVTAISAGGITYGSEAHTCAVRHDEMYCWGYRGSGRIGDGSSSTTNPRTSPVAVLATPAATTVTVTATAASGHTAAVPFTIRTATPS